MGIIIMVLLASPVRKQFWNLFCFVFIFLHCGGGFGGLAVFHKRNEPIVCFQLMCSFLGLENFIKETLTQCSGFWTFFWLVIWTCRPVHSTSFTFDLKRTVSYCDFLGDFNFEFFFSISSVELVGMNFVSLLEHTVCFRACHSRLNYLVLGAKLPYHPTSQMLMVCAIEMLPADSLQFPYFQICMTHSFYFVMLPYTTV
jgi:hypothetical protein